MKTETATLLIESRAAHQQAKNLKRLGDHVGASQWFTRALEKRLAARQADPGKDDPEWLNDSLTQPLPTTNVRQGPRHHHRRPGMTKAEIAAAVDADLEMYFREQLGQVQNPESRVADPEIVVPTQWVLEKAGATDDNGQSICKQRHTNQLLTFDQRTCQVCGQVERLTPTKAREDTEAFKQLQKERS